MPGIATVCQDMLIRLRTEGHMELAGKIKCLEFCPPPPFHEETDYFNY